MTGSAGIATAVPASSPKKFRPRGFPRGRNLDHRKDQSCSRSTEQARSAIIRPSPRKGAKQRQAAPVVKEQNHSRRNIDERCPNRDALRRGLYARCLCAALHARIDRRAVRLPDRLRLIGAGLVGLVAAGAAFGILALLFDTLRSPILRLFVALIFAAPAAVAGYALVHGITKESVPSEIWRQIFCIIGGGFVGVSALLRLAAPLPGGTAPAR